MATVLRVGEPMWIDRGVSTRDARIATAGLLATSWSDDPMAIRSGILPDAKLSALRVVPTEPTQSMAVRVLNGHAVIAQSGQGAWIVPVEETLASIDIAPPDATNRRVDLVVLRVYDLEQGDTPPVAPDLNSSGVATIEVIQGTPSPFPAPPITPVRAVALATITVDTTATSIGSSVITERRVFTGTRGAVRLPGNATNDDARLGFIGEVLANPDGLLRVQIDHLVRRGVQPKMYSVGLDNPVGTIYLAPRTLVTLSIPDPGFPYQLDVTGGIAINPSSTLQVGLDCYLDSVGGSKVTATTYSGQLGDGYWTIRIGASLGVTYTGSHTLRFYLSYASGTDGQFQLQTTGPYDHVFNAVVLPAVGA